jgi:hypothetical protein
MTPIALAAAGWTIRETPNEFKAKRGTYTIEANSDGRLWDARLLCVGADRIERVEVYTHNWNDRAAALDTLSERAWGGTTVGAFCGV